MSSWPGQFNISKHISPHQYCTVFLTILFCSMYVVAFFTTVSPLSPSFLSLYLSHAKLVLPIHHLQTKRWKLSAPSSIGTFPLARLPPSNVRRCLPRFPVIPATISGQNHPTIASLASSCFKSPWSTNLERPKRRKRRW